MSVCPCGSNLEFDLCCNPIISGERDAPTAEALMRARYSAFATCQVDFLHQSLHPEHRADHDRNATQRWAANSEWLGLEIAATEGGMESDREGMVEFIATFKEKGVTRRYHEQSQFKKEDGRWFFVDGNMVKPKTEVHGQVKVGRNEPCPCGSGKKYKRCCGA
ncbi:MAG: SEC-C domain-containing protein [Gammaproteobacteria bacterium]|nr:SEC-C domain-containing protein [Gammaproteobacteria bacterium]